MNSEKVEHDSLPLRSPQILIADIALRIRLFDVGRGNKVLAPGSIVTAEMTIRCKSLATQKDPGGKQNTPSVSFLDKG